MSSVSQQAVYVQLTFACVADVACSTCVRGAVGCVRDQHRRHGKRGRGQYGTGLRGTLRHGLAPFRSTLTPPCATCAGWLGLHSPPLRSGMGSASGTVRAHDHRYGRERECADQHQRGVCVGFRMG